MEALSRAATAADLIMISSAADWQGCDVRRFGWAAAAQLIALGSADKYKDDTSGEKAGIEQAQCLLRSRLFPLVCGLPRDVRVS